MSFACRSCAVFFVPSGREASYQFTAQDCLTDIAEQAQTKRLLVVRCNRPHVFPDMKGMQAELSPVCRSLAPVGAEDEAIPFMGVLTESEWTIVTTDVGEKTGATSILQFLVLFALFNLILIVRRACCGRDGIF